MKLIICFLLLITILESPIAARILDNVVDPQLPFGNTFPATFPQAPIVTPNLPENPTLVFPPTVTTPGADAPAPLDDVPVDTPTCPEPIVSLVAVPATQVVATTTTIETSVAIPLAPTTATAETPALTFFMHGVLGGTQASGRVVTCIVATSYSSNIPFSKPNNQVFPVSGGVPLFNNQINNIVNNNNAPLLTALNSQQLQQQQSNTLVQNAGTSNNVVNGGTNQAFVTAGQPPQGVSLQELMFGSITVIDDEITEGHELGSTVIGSAQGFYLAVSLDGESHTMVWTALFHGEHEGAGTISFFGVHKPASPVSYVAVIGGTGKYENAKGYATIESLPQVDQHTTDVVETIVYVSVYLS